MRLIGSGVILTAGVATSRIPIPDDESGNRANYVWLLQMGASTNEAHFRVGDVGVLATTADVPCPLFGIPLRLNVRGYTHIAAIRTGAGDLDISISAVDR